MTQELGPAHHVLRPPSHIRKINYTTNGIDMRLSKLTMLFYLAQRKISPNGLYTDLETAEADFGVCYRQFMVGRLLDDSALL